MKLKTAKSAGFCFGVQKAIDAVYHEIEYGQRPIYTFGPIIHNEEVVSELERRGVTVLKTVEEIEQKECGTIIIRSHGVSRKIRERMEQSRLRVVDATCPFVLRIHKYVREYSSQGYYVVIIGDAAHPEVQGIYGWSDPQRTTILSEQEEAEKFTVPKEGRVCIVSQTTFNYNKFQDLVEIISEKGYDRIVLNTICSATEQRQKEAEALSGQVDAMIVIGGKSSSNSRKLFEICSKKCKNTYFIQTKDDLENSTFQRFGYVGITAGASTPNNIIEEVQKYVRNEL
ncbi:4-hydroxy-3-methylbut-2-enyl diphosphate reductase [uncultured Roseburia sp.]|uniref:4-hydroxy-3-methylbut-2-enyl diphosphate reductase n=1 Tax=Brotonthovivens ammoniilytica TaxID=2981725 RepID=A0ABT2TII0_9FIRM|nr:4-hydroxy-3-methylbut-2-enyl diphosphate reductase [Brotonthovivens ammoniilytica]MCU6761339.1 4-hydroxy-3-methylbut-2-enyl diphosphate reductase [Brotonthovivens ammoniilytica]SCI25656.1 4-hydroxy-3-methylbut-2-enyl diphosphate reductase [uncultured Roseburia sp.]